MARPTLCQNHPWSFRCAAMPRHGAPRCEGTTAGAEREHGGVAAIYSLACCLCRSPGY
ncbi:hypothetical protein C8Q77DRAFT_1144530 [Trametes polyzona]|nr:hypothetical protein C8Q77DRAFT_1144477 [Trametes polyzona]KAI0629015.1 hypothetical protein C8Q77DRAFT_1144530 [Trametes polyzona]